MAEKGEMEENNVKWMVNSYTLFLKKLLIVSFLTGLILFIIAIYTFILVLNNNFNIGLSSIFLVIAFILFATTYASFLTLRESPSQIGFTNEGFFCNYKKDPTFREFNNFKLIKWKDINNIKHAVGPIGRVDTPTHYNLNEKEIKSSIRSGLLIFCKEGNNYELYNVSKHILEKIVKYYNQQNIKNS